MLCDHVAYNSIDDHDYQQFLQGDDAKDATTEV